jgi:glucose-6-phosphate isomerase
MKEFWDGPLPDPAIRTIDEMRDVLADPVCTTGVPLYFMYRDCFRSGDREWLLDSDIRFDITLIPALTLCGEYVKTKGHYHPASTGGTGYPEVYQVLSGEAHYLLQHRSLSDIVVVPAQTGEVVCVPPDYGHVTINAAPRLRTVPAKEIPALNLRHGVPLYDLITERADLRFLNEPERFTRHLGWL